MKKISFLLVMILFIAACDVSINKEQTNTEDVKSEKVEAQIAIIDVKGMHCESCVNSITTVLTELEGVGKAKVSLEYEQAKVKFDPAVISTEDLKAAIVDKGYEVGEIKVMNAEDQSKKTTE